MIAANGETRRALALAFGCALVAAFGTELGKTVAERLKSLLSGRVTPRRPPPSPPPPIDPARCPALTKRGKQCIYALKPGEAACPNHDPARAAERAAAGAIRNGDPGTELGGYPGITRRAVRILEELEQVAEFTPAVANARRNALRFLAELVARRDQSVKAAKALEEVSMGRGSDAGEAKPMSLEDTHMSSKPVTVAEAVAVLNRLVAADPDAMSALVNHRVPANQALVDDPTAQCGTYEGVARIGLVGVLNAIFGADEKSWGYIMVQVDEETGFAEYFLERKPT